MQISLNIGLIGYGKMGQMVERIALERGHSIAFVAKGPDDAWKKADVLIEFSRPEAALKNIRKAMGLGIPLVIGTTGWNDHLHQIEDEVSDAAGSLLHASNFSIGVNLFFVLNQELAKLMASVPDYHAQIDEIHHLEKRDSPSGTAISLAEDLMEERSSYTHWTDYLSESTSDLPVLSHREADVPGTHIVTWESDVDRIELKHEAKNRKGFALGAVIAAEWLPGHKGTFTMKDVLNNKINIPQ